MSVFPGEVIIEPPVPAIAPAPAPVVLVEPGRPGPQGPPGTSADPFVWDQITPAATWTIPHGLGRVPASVEVLLVTGEVVEPDEDLDAVFAVLTFAVPTAGQALIL